jgi:hypothetical protein
MKSGIKAPDLAVINQAPLHMIKFYFQSGTLIFDLISMTVKLAATDSGLPRQVSYKSTTLMPCN